MDRDLEVVSRVVRRSRTPQIYFRATVLTTAALGDIRAASLRRDVEVEDYEFALSILCWWPFKPASNQKNRVFIQRARRRLLRLGEQSPELIFRVISPSLLSMTRNQLFSVLKTGNLSAYFNFAALRREAQFHEFEALRNDDDDPYELDADSDGVERD